MFAKKIIIVGAAFFLLSSVLGCGQLIKDPPSKFTDPTLDRYLKKFIEEANSHGVSLPGLAKLRVLKFVDDFHAYNDGSKKIVGLCSKRSQGFVGGKRWREIRILRRGASVGLDDGGEDKVLEYIVYHELGHCLLNLDHNKGGGEGPLLMRPSVPMNSARWIAYKWEEMVEELFVPPGEKNLGLFADGSADEEGETKHSPHSGENCGTSELSLRSSFLTTLSPVLSEGSRGNSKMRSK